MVKTQKEVEELPSKSYEWLYSYSFWLKVLAVVVSCLLIFGIVIPRIRTNNDLSKHEQDAELDSSYNEVLNKICQPENSIENANIPRALAMSPMTRGFPPEKQNIAATSCATLNEIAATQGIEIASSEKYSEKRKQCDQANQYINTFMKKYNPKLKKIIGDARSKIDKTVELFTITLHDKIDAYRSAHALDDTQSAAVAKAVESLEYLKQLNETVVTAYTSWVGNCGEHSHVAAARLLVAQLKGQLLPSEIFHVVVRGTGTSHEFILLAKNESLIKLEAEGDIYGLNNINAFIRTYGISICDTWNFFDKGGFQTIDGIKTARFYGFGEAPMEWSYLFYKRVQRFEEIEKKKIPMELYNFFEKEYHKIKKDLFAIVEKIEKDGKPDTAFNLSFDRETIDDSIASHKLQK